MKVTIRDREALNQLSILDVRGYLLSQGWTDQGRYGSVAAIYGRADEHNVGSEILLPLHSRVADYAARMSEVIEVLADYEERSELSVYHDLIRSGFDIVRFRDAGADHAGTIDLGRGVALYDNARDLLAAAANAAVNPRRVHRGNPSDKARHYIDELRLGQTEVGSYILTVLSPVPPSLSSDQLLLFEDVDGIDEPFSRTVTSTLASALLATSSALLEATATGRLDPFLNSVQSGVSANLCETIAELVEGGDLIEIGLTWSKVRAPPKMPPRKFCFDKDNARLLSEAARTLREVEPEPDVSLEGFVVGLQREPQEFDGKVKIRGFVGGKIRTIVAEFPRYDYQKLVTAHNEKYRVRMDGELVRRGQIQVLQNARHLEVIEDREDSEEAAE